MTTEEKELLLKDLCARLQYGVKCKSKYFDNDTLSGIILDEEETMFNFSVNNEGFITQLCCSEFKPYLFPLSSMTDEQAKELFNIFGLVCPSTEEDYIKINECTGITFFLCQGFDVETHLDKLIDWLNKNHFDYRGLIEKELAIDATNKNIYKKLKL